MCFLNFVGGQNAPVQADMLRQNSPPFDQLSIGPVAKAVSFGIPLDLTEVVNAGAVERIATAL